MPGIDLEKVYADPGFQAMPEADQRAVLKELGYDSPQASGQKLLGGSEAKLSAGTEGESVWAKAREAVSQAIFGSSDRAEARAAGIGLQPTTAEMAETLGTGAAMAAAPAAAGMVGRGAMAAGRAVLPMAPRAYGAYSGGKAGYRAAGVPGALVGAGVGAMRPVGTSAAIGAIEGLAEGGVPGAVIGGATGAVLGGGAGKVLSAIKGAQTPQEIAGFYQALRSGGVAAPAVAEAVAPAAQAAVTAGGYTKDVAAMLKAAKEAGREFKVGEKIWVLIKDGKAVKLLTPDQAAAAKRAGQLTTWVKNLGGS